MEGASSFQTALSVIFKQDNNGVRGWDCNGYLKQVREGLLSSVETSRFELQPDSIKERREHF